MKVGLYASHRLREHTRLGDLRLEGIGSKPQRVFRVLGKVEYQISVRLTCRVPIRVVEAVTVFGIRLTCQVEELVLVPDFLQEYQIFSV